MAFIEDEIAEIKKLLTTDDNGYFTLESFEALQIFKPIAEQHTLDDVIQALSVFDNDNDGRLSIQELEEAMRNFGVPLNEGEGGGKSNMTYEEFQIMHTDLKREGDIIVDGFVEIENFARTLID